MLSDDNARRQAVNPRLSAIVQAPAGSGKTELLTQRFLNLLATVEAPEHIVALTFTRKAAHEMQARILDRLKTHDAARKRDEARDWQLLKNPNRLRVTTLDSLCQSLTQAIPLQEKHVPYATITDAPSKLYWKAARSTVDYAIATPDYQPAITVLLTHLDNRRDVLLGLLTEQLAKRDQWLAPVYQAQMQDKTHLEAALSQIEAHALNQFKRTLPEALTPVLIQLASEVAAYDTTPDAPREILATWQTLDAFDKKHAKALASLLLTSQKKLRKSFDHHVGLKRENTPPERYKALKAESKALLCALSEAPDFLDALLRVRALPEPAYLDTEWPPLQALLTLLPLLAGHLQVVFQAAQSTDFIGITHQALDALGPEEAPSDLGLYLDYSMQHVLIDEFQDTSIQQFELIRRLVRGFEPTDGRTLFVVGDPMQSIYRFRAAEVGLFLRAQQQGIGPVHLTPLYLESNFRSNTSLVRWVNQYFADIFPATDDFESGAVSFHPATPTKSNQDTIIQAFACAHIEAEAIQIAKCVQTTQQANPDETVAILVRSRRQLPAITKALDALNLSYQGLDTELTQNLPHVKDVLSLTKALLMPADRLACLAFLRSPWGGFDLSDLYCIANYAPTEPIFSALEAPDCIQQLGPSGQLRARFIAPVLSHALKTRYQDPLVIWIIHTLKALHLPHMLTSDEALALEALFETLEAFEQDGLISEFALFEAALGLRYAKKTQTSPIQLMTIHKAKGLEFDTVILPGLGRRAPAPDKPLLRWLTLPSEQTDDLILISPLKAAQHDADQASLYDYLGELDAEKNKYEQHRLLYVAATRAKKRLYLFDHAEKTTQNTFRSALGAYPFTPVTTDKAPETAAHQYPKRRYLPDAFYEQYTPVTAHAADNPPSTLPELTPARTLGIITHSLIEWICTYQPQTLEAIPWQLMTPALNQLDLSSAARDAAEQQIKTWVTQLFEDPRGQWLIQAHAEAHSEYSMLVFQNDRLNTRIMDRVFVSDGIYWIVDFKTGQPESGHQHQLNQYARHLKPHTTLPIHCGLYYLEDAEWMAWAFEPKYATMPEFY